jgi:hypothetical protein
MFWIRGDHDLETGRGNGQQKFAVSNPVPPPCNRVPDVVARKQIAETASNIVVKKVSQGTGTPIDFSRACARPARAFRPSRYVLTSVPGRFNTLHPSRQ